MLSSAQQQAEVTSEALNEACKLLVKGHNNVKSLSRTTLNDFYYEVKLNI